MDIKQLKKELGLTNADMAKFFGLNPKAYYYSSARKRYEDSFIRIYSFLRDGEKKKNQNTTDVETSDEP
jgi:predicted transcriptional regulator